MARDHVPSTTPTNAKPLVWMLLLLILGPILGYQLLTLFGLNLATWGGATEVASRLWLLSSFTGSVIVTRAILGELLTTKYNALRDDKDFTRTADHLRDFLSLFILLSFILCLIPSSFFTSVPDKYLHRAVILLVWALFIVASLFVGVKVLMDVFPAMKAAVRQKCSYSTNRRNVFIVRLLFIVTCVIVFIALLSFPSITYTFVSALSSIVVLKLWAALATGYVLHCDCRIRDCAGRVAATISENVKRMESSAHNANAIRKEYDETVKMVDIPTLVVILLVVILDITYKYIGFGDGVSVSTSENHQLIVTLREQGGDLAERVIQMVHQVDERFTGMVTETYVNGFSSGAVAVELCFANVIYWIITKR